jgi:hypothetical protein
MIARQWKKGGPSPNPSGRPKHKPIEEELLKLIDSQVDSRDKRTHARKIVDAMLRQAWQRQSISGRC